MQKDSLERLVRVINRRLPNQTHLLVTDPHDDAHCHIVLVKECRIVDTITVLLTALHAIAHTQRETLREELGALHDLNDNLVKDLRLIDDMLAKAVYDERKKRKLNEIDPTVAKTIIRRLDEKNKSR